MAIRLQVCASLLSLPFARVAAVQLLAVVCNAEETGLWLWCRSQGTCVCAYSYTSTCAHAPVSAYAHTRVLMAPLVDQDSTASLAEGRVSTTPKSSPSTGPCLPAELLLSFPGVRGHGGERSLSLSCAVTSSLKKVLVEYCPQQSRHSFVSRRTELQAAVAADFCSDSPNRLTSPCHLSLPDVILRALAGRGYTERGDTQ